MVRAGDARRGAARRALLRQLTFSLAVLAVEIPLGILLALSMPAQGWKSSAVLVVVALSLLIPWNVWAPSGRSMAVPTSASWAYCCRRWASNTATGNATQAWLTVLLMDVWHWTPLVALLAVCRAALHPGRVLPGGPHRRREQVRGVPLHPAAQDAWRADDCGAAALHGQLHDLHRALRAHRRRAGQPTTFLEPVPHAKAVGQFDLGPAAAFSLIYFFIILLLCFILYNWMQRVGTASDEGAGHE